MGFRDSSGAAAARGLGWLLRAQYDGVMREPLPARWVELINCLDEKERLKSERLRTNRAASAHACGQGYSRGQIRSWVRW